MTVRLAGVLNRELADATGLSQADFEVLVELLEHPEDSIRDITLRCGLEWEKSRLSHQLRRMEARGLVARGACFEDSRSSTVSLTDTGKDAARRAKDVEAAVLARYLASALSAEQLEQMTQVSDAILDALGSAHPHGTSPGNHRRGASETTGGLTDERDPTEDRLPRA